MNKNTIELYFAYGDVMYNLAVLEYLLGYILAVKKSNEEKSMLVEVKELYSKLTFGQLLNSIKDCKPNDIPQELDTILGALLVRRNYLAHDFFKAIALLGNDLDSKMAEIMQHISTTHQSCKQAIVLIQKYLQHYPRFEDITTLKTKK